MILKYHLTFLEEWRERREAKIMSGEIDRTIQKQQEGKVIATAAKNSLQANKLATLKPLVSDCSNLSKMSHNSVKSQHKDMKYIFFLPL